MKLTLWTLASDTDAGTYSNVFLSEKELHAHLLDIMPKQGEEESDAQLDALLASGDVDEAWSYWQEHLKGNYLDTYNIETHTLEIPADVTIEVRGGVAEVTACTSGINVEIIDHDNETSSI